MRARARIASIVAAAVFVACGAFTPSPAAATSPPSRSIVATTVTTSFAHGPAHTTREVRTHGPRGEDLACDELHAFADEGGQFTLQHRCGGDTAPWGYRIAPELRDIAVGPVKEQGVDWTLNGVTQKRLAQHLEAADYIFHGTFPHSPDGSVITYVDHYSFRHDVNGGGEVNILVEGAFTLMGAPA